MLKERKQKKLMQIPCLQAVALLLVWFKHLTLNSAPFYGLIYQKLDRVINNDRYVLLASCRLANVDTFFLNYIKMNFFCDI